MATRKLYKFRSLGSCTDLDRAKEILTTGKFWCSHFWELNDPMEGVYSYTTGTLDEAITKKLLYEKTRMVLCSFSAEVAFNRPLLWGYYGNGFKGFAVEIDVKHAAHAIQEVKYVSNLADITHDVQPEEAAKRVLTTKLNAWKHEAEFRFLSHGESGPREIGTITAVYFGNPYGQVDNHGDVQILPQVRDYLCRARKLIDTARAKGVQCHRVEYSAGKVKDAGLVTSDWLVK